MRTESGSSLACFRTCPKKYEFQYEKRLSPKGYSSSLWYGTFVHAFRALAHATTLGDERLALAETESHQVFEEAMKLYPANEEEIKADYQLASRMSQLWWAYWQKADNEYAERNLEWIDVEREWMFPVDRIGNHVGKRDGYLKHRVYPVNFLYELKTASSRDKESYLSVLNLDYQINSNLMALAMDDLPWSGVLYDIIWKPALIRKTERKTMADETWPEFHDRLVAEVQGNPDKYFQRVFVTRSNDQLVEYQSELHTQIETLENMKVKYRNPSACRMYNQLCTYHQACMDPKSVDLESAFQVRERKHPELHTLGNE